MRTLHDQGKSSTATRRGNVTGSRLCRLLIPFLAALLAALSLDVASSSMASDPAASFLDYYRRPPVDTVMPGSVEARRIALGQMLFFERRLSHSQQMSCASCHNPALAWQDGRRTGLGDRGNRLSRRTPTLLNIGWSEPLFWDGRADTLELQAPGPLLNPDEMGLRADRLVPTVSRNAAYRRAFGEAFPGKPIALETVAAALAAYQRTIVSAPSPFDRWVEGDPGAISAAARRGFVLFNTTAKCAACHMGWRFTDDGFHDIGLPGADRGRAAIVPGIAPLEKAFKTPTLRSIAYRAPYMHDGSIATLEQVLDHYDHGFIARPSLSDQIGPLHLSARDKHDLIAFMKSLSSPSRSGAPAVLSPSKGQ